MSEGNVRRNEKLMQVIKRAHGLLGTEDLEKARQSQDQIGAIFGRNKEIRFQDVDMEGVHGEWVCLNRAHNKKQVILHCHGGG